jgi:hypothetical protein
VILDVTRRVPACRVPSLLAVLLGLLAPVAAQDATPHPLDPAIRVAKESRRALDGVTDFQAVFSKQEIVGERLQPPETMFVKLRRKPFSVYFKFLRPHAGREVLYVDGLNDGNILAHESGIASLVGTVSIAVDSPRAMQGSRHPITMMGMTTMVDTVLAQWEEETKYGESEVKYFPNAKLQEMECKVVQTSHPVPRKEFKFHMTRLYIDRKTNLPVRVEQYGFPARPGEKPPLVEQYTYSQLKLNNGFDDRDFDPRNPQYAF